MSTTKVSTQKVIAVLKKSNLTIDRSSTRFGSGFSVTGIYDDHPYIEISYYCGSSRNIESFTEKIANQLVLAAQALKDAEITPLIHWDSDGVPELKLLVRKDGGDSSNRAIVFNTSDFLTSLAPNIAKEKTRHQKEQKIQNEKTEAAAKAQAERLAQAKFLNPSIAWDMTYTQDLKVCHVILLDNRVAVLTVATKVEKEICWRTTPLTEYMAIKAEITSVTTSKYSGGWDTNRQSLIGGENETIEDMILFWITKQ